jgi:hypothetical protein
MVRWPGLAALKMQHRAIVTIFSVLVGKTGDTTHNGGKGYHQEVSDLPFAKAMTELPMSVIMKSRLQGSFDPLPIKIPS